MIVNVEGVSSQTMQMLEAARRLTIETDTANFFSELDAAKTLETMKLDEVKDGLADAKQREQADYQQTLSKFNGFKDKTTQRAVKAGEALDQAKTAVANVKKQLPEMIKAVTAEITKARNDIKAIPQ